MTRIFEYFVVCGIGPEISTLDGNKGYHGTGVMYLPSVLDQYPPSNNALYPPPPPQLSTCVLPAGVEFYSSGLNPNDASTFPKSYPIVLTEGDGSKIYVSCIAFRDPVCDDIAEAYRIPANSFADKCICLVSRSPSFRVLRDALEELFALCFSPDGSSKPLWDIIAYIVSGVPLPTPGKDRVLFAIENCLLSVEAPTKDGLPYADISFQPLVQCLDVDNLITLFTAVLLERRILLRSNKWNPPPDVKRLFAPLFFRLPKKRRRMMWRCIRAAVIWTIWEERNSRIFSGKERSKEAILEVICIRVIHWLKSMELFNNVSSDDLLRKWREVAFSAPGKEVVVPV